METNLGVIDRSIRIFLGVGILALMFLGPETKLGLLGLIPLISGVVGYSPLYRRFKLSTVKGAHGKARPQRPGPGAPLAAK